MEHPVSPAAVCARTQIARLQQTVQAWIDSDRILLADGSALLTTLDRVQQGLAGGDSEEGAPGAAAQAGIAAFVDQVQALIAAGLA